jgi:uncharacterized protein YndB with AHSA1/START domain
VNATATETIRKEIFVDASPETAFRVFTEQIAVVFEDRDGWQLTETAKDGRETVWGEVLDYEFASRLRMTWHPGKDPEAMPTEIELTFVADGDGTQVVLEHRGWEKMAEELRGARSGYDAGWDEVLANYRAAS